MPHKTALLINDTSASYHWGCYGTSTEIKATLEEKGYAVAPLGAVNIARVTSPPRTNAQILDRGFTQAFLEANPKISDALSQCDIAIINGEGTLHGTGQAAFTLLFLARLAKVEFDKPTYAINMSLFPSDDGQPDEALDSFYGDVLSALDQIVVREPLSFDVAKRLGLSPDQGFDCLPRYLRRLSVRDDRHTDGPILLGGGLGVDPARFASIAATLSDKFGSRPLHYVIGAQAHPALDDQKVIDHLSVAAPTLTVKRAHTFDDWIDSISTASCLISGRFHHTIAAYCVGTPALVFETGTPKIHGLCHTLDNVPPLSMRDPSLLDQVTAFVEDVFAGHAEPMDDAMRDLLLERGARNFEDL